MSHLEKSRSDLERGIDKNKESTEKGQKKLDEDVKDKKLIAEIASKMRGKGTMEGMDKVAKKGEQAGEKVDRETDKDKQNLEKNAHKEAQEREKDLKERVDETKKDAHDLQNATRIVHQQEAKGALQEASHDATEDERYLTEKKRTQEEIRKRSEQQAEQKNRDVRSNRPDFRRR